MESRKIQPQSLDKLSNESPPEDIFTKGASLRKNRILIEVNRHWAVVEHLTLRNDNTYRLTRRQMLKHVDVDAVYDEKEDVKAIEITYGYGDSYYTVRYETDDDTDVLVWWKY